MSAKILDGRIIRDEALKELKYKVSKLKRKPHLAIIQIGSLEESNAYIEQKKKFGEQTGFKVSVINFEKSSLEEEVIYKIQNLNKNKNVDGIIVQLPIPNKFNLSKIIESINEKKDVDGLGSKNIKKLFSGEVDGIIPATTRGIISLLKWYKISINSKKVVIIGRSNLVGKPTALKFLSENATVTICHSKTKDLKKETKEAEILISATGIPNLITKDFVSKDQVIIDVGINLINGNGLKEEILGRKFVGDVCFEEVSKIVKAISPVPGGVGPMTVVSLFQNLFEAHNRQ